MEVSNADQNNLAIGSKRCGFQTLVSYVRRRDAKSILCAGRCLETRWLADRLGALKQSRVVSCNMAEAQQLEMGNYMKHHEATDMTLQPRPT